MLHLLRKGTQMLFGLAVLLALSFGTVQAFGASSDPPCWPDGHNIIGSCDVVDCVYECEWLRGGMAWCDPQQNCCMCVYR